MAVDLSVFDRQKSIVDQQQLQQAFELKKAAAIADLQKAASGGDMPAPIKVANRMFELQQIATNPALPEADRRAANTQYNLLGQSAKTFGFDRGIEYDFPALPPVEQPQQPAQGAVSGKPRGLDMPMYTPPQGEDMAIDAGEYIDLPQSPQGTDFSQFPDLQPVQTPRFGIQPISGYGSAVGDIAATKAGMEEQAKRDVQLRMNPQIKTAEKEATNIVDARVNFGKVADNYTTSKSIIDQALASPGLDSNFGATGLIPNMPGGEASDASTIIDQIEGGAFLTAFETLKGGGQITEVEGAKATNAIVRMKRAQSADAFRQALGDYMAVLDRGVERARKEASGEVYEQWKNPTTAPAQAEQETKTIGGTTYIKQNGKWFAQ